MSKLTKGTKVQVNRKHWGTRGMKGRVTTAETIRGALYYHVRLTSADVEGNRDAVGWVILYARRELNVVQG